MNMYYNDSRKGESMKIKKWHLFLFISILFICSFYIVNLKFDKFYRVNGINNDNRVLIEKYLDEDEQTYLIDNQISIDLFIDYLDKDNFSLQNYQYYNYLKETHRYKKSNEIIEIGNDLATRLNYLYSKDAFDKAKVLIDSSLEIAFLNEERFQFDYIDIYNDMKILYEKNDFSYVNDCERLIQFLENQSITKEKDIKETIHMMTLSYTKEAIVHFIENNLDGKISIVYNPNELSTLVDKNHYIGIYEPNGLLLTQDIPRVSYAMYLQSDAYHALLKMYHDLSLHHDGFILRQAYKSAYDLKEEAGYNELQLGLTIVVSQTQIAYDQFEDTEISKWLQEHAHEYGFVLRYPKGKASITNHSYDAHTYRYVGKSLAQSLHESQLTIEEFQNQNDS